MAHRNRIWSFCCLLIGTIILCPAIEAGTVDLEVNPVNGFLESVGIDGSGNVAHLIDSGPMGGQTMTILSVSPGLEPRLSISDGGDTSVVWLDATGALSYRRRVLATKRWDLVVDVADGVTAGSAPAVGATHDDAWVAYETSIGGDRTILAREIIDSAEPFGAVSIATVVGSHELDLRVFREAGETWVVWDDAATQLGWSVLDVATDLWSAPQSLTFAPANKTAAYQSIYDLVVDP